MNLNQDSSNFDLRSGKIVLAGCIILFIIYCIYTFSFEKSLASNMVILPGRIINVDHPARSSPKVHFVYTFKGEQYQASQSFPVFKNYKQASVLIGKVFPVAIDSTQASHRRILMDSVSFKELGLIYPDSLQWLYRYLE